MIKYKQTNGSRSEVHNTREGIGRFRPGEEDRTKDKSKKRGRDMDRTQKGCGQREDCTVSAKRQALAITVQEANHDPLPKSRLQRSLEKYHGIQRQLKVKTNKQKIGFDI